MSGPNERDEIAAVLADHLWHHTATTHCACGFRTPLAQLAIEGYVQHVASVMTDLLAERDRRTAATALRRFADRFRVGDSNPWALHVRARARRTADRIERGE